MADACIGQIFTTNNEKHHFLRSARIKCGYAITHVLDLSAGILIIITNHSHKTFLSIHVKKKIDQDKSNHMTIHCIRFPNVLHARGCFDMLAYQVRN